MITSRKLPDWVTDRINDNDRETVNISWDSDNKVFVTDNGLSRENIIDLYDDLVDEYDIIFDDSTDGVQGEIVDDSMFVRDGDQFYRLLIGNRNNIYLDFTESEWKSFFTVINPAYQSNPDNFHTSMAFLDNHPALWLYHPTSRTWITENILNSMPIDVFLERGNTVFRLEFGSHVSGEISDDLSYTIRYFDSRLTAKSYSYEEMIIDAARNLNKYFNPDGSEKQSC